MSVSHLCSLITFLRIIGQNPLRSLLSLSQNSNFVIGYLIVEDIVSSWFLYSVELTSFCSYNLGLSVFFRYHSFISINFLSLSDQTNFIWILISTFWRKFDGIYLSRVLFFFFFTDYCFCEIVGVELNWVTSVILVSVFSVYKFVTKIIRFLSFHFLGGLFANSFKNNEV